MFVVAFAVACGGTIQSSVGGDGSADGTSTSDAGPAPDDATVLDAAVVDAPYLLINPLHYPWADAIRASDLPATIA